LASLCSFSNMGIAATSNISQVFHNPKIYTAIFNEQTQEYDSVLIENGTTATLTAPIEYEVDFGGSCDSGVVLETSDIMLIGDDANVNTHTWQVDESTGMIRKAFGSSYTQHQHLLKACNAELRNIIEEEPAFPHGATLETLKETPFTIWEVRTHRVKHTLHCSDGTKANTLADINTSIICNTANVKAPKRKKVKKVQAKLNGVSHGMQAHCPVDASLDIQIQTNVVTDVQYKVVSGTGLVSHSKTMSVDEKVADKTYEGNATISFSVPMDYEPTVTPNSATGNYQINQTPLNEYTQSFRVEISKPHKAKSEYVDYYVTCIPSVNPGFGLADQITTTDSKQVFSQQTIKKMDSSKAKRLGGSKAATQTPVASGLATGKRQHSPTVVANESAEVIASNPSHHAATDLQTNVLPDLSLTAFIYHATQFGTLLEASNAKSKNNGVCIFELDYHVFNKSKRHVSSAFKNTIQINGVVVKQHAFSSNPTGGKLFAKLPIGLKEGMNNLIISIDAENSVNESKENNNAFERNIVVNGSCKGLATGKRPAEKKPILKNKIQKQKIKSSEHLSR
jgi:hypothetical protein